MAAKKKETLDVVLVRFIEKFGDSTEGFRLEQYKLVEGMRLYILAVLEEKREVVPLEIFKAMCAREEDEKGPIIDPKRMIEILVEAFEGVWHQL